MRQSHDSAIPFRLKLPEKVSNIMILFTCFIYIYNKQASYTQNQSLLYDIDATLVFALIFDNVVDYMYVERVYVERVFPLKFHAHTFLNN